MCWQKPGWRLSRRSFLGDAGYDGDGTEPDGEAGYGPTTEREGERASGGTGGVGSNRPERNLDGDT